MEEPEPQPKKYDFKERSFKRDNAPASAHPPMPTAKELAMLAGAATPQTPADPAGLNGGVDRTADPNDVYAVLQHNRAVEQHGGLDTIEIKPVRSRRRRDFWLLLAPADILLAWFTWLGRDNPFQLVLGISGMALITVGLAWIMFQVMDNY